MREIQLPRSDGSSWEIIDAGVAAIKAPIRRIHWFADDGGYWSRHSSKAINECLGLSARADVWNWALAGFGSAHLGLFFFQNLDRHRSVAHQ